MSLDSIRKAESAGEFLLQDLMSVGAEDDVNFVLRSVKVVE
jgi:hypothetical protein